MIGMGGNLCSYPCALPIAFRDTSYKYNLNKQALAKRNVKTNRCLIIIFIFYFYFIYFKCKQFKFTFKFLQ